MADQKLKDYIKQNIDRLGPEKMRKTLLESGWGESQINEALQEFSASTATPAGKTAKKGVNKTLIVSIIVVVAIAAVAAYVLISGLPQPGPPTPPVPPPQQQTTPIGIGVSPASSSASVGDTITIDIMASDSEVLFGFQFNLEYDSAIIRLESISEGTFLNNNGEDSTFCVPPDTNTPGLVKNYACTRLKEQGQTVGVSGSGILASVTFSAISSGTSPVALSRVKLSNPEAKEITSDISSGQIVIE